MVLRRGTAAKPTPAPAAAGHGAGSAGGHGGAQEGAGTARIVRVKLAREREAILLAIQCHRPIVAVHHRKQRRPTWRRARS